MAALLAAAFFAYVYSQRGYEVGAQAQALADELSRTSFSALYQTAPTYDLPKSVGGAYYEVRIDNETNTFIVEADGKSYRSAAGTNIKSVDSLPDSGGTLHALGVEDRVLISSNPIPSENYEVEVITITTPEFYYFAKDNAREAAAITAAYFRAIKAFPGENLDIQEYEWENSNTLLARVTSGGELLTVMRVGGYENSQDIGYIKNAWIVEEVENTSEDISGTDCPSIENAVSSGWVYSSSQIIRHLKTRAWYKNDQPIKIPQDVKPTPSTATTSVSTYPTYRFEFLSGTTEYTLHFGLMSWKIDENQPGFVFESKPELEVEP